MAKNQKVYPLTSEQQPTDTNNVDSSVAGTARVNALIPAAPQHPQPVQPLLPLPQSQTANNTNRRTNETATRSQGVKSFTDTSTPAALLSPSTFRHSASLPSISRKDNNKDPQQQHPLEESHPPPPPPPPSTKNNLDPQHSQRSTVSSSSSLPDLVSLSDTDTIFAIRQLDRVKVLVPLRQIKINKYFKVYNARGEHVLFAGEVQSCLCSRFSQWSLLFYIFNLDGQPLITVTQRNESYQPSCAPKSRKNWQLHRQADEWLNRKFKLLTGADVDDSQAHIHVSLLSGAFLGHIWCNSGGDDCICHDIDYSPTLSIVRRGFKENEMVVLRKAERRKSGFTESLASSCDILYELYVETTQVGEICGNITFKKDLEALGVEPKDCVGATFPVTLEPEDKAIILAFLLYYQRTDSVWRTVCSICLNTYVFVFLALLLVALVVLCLLRIFNQL